MAKVRVMVVDEHLLTMLIANTSLHDEFPVFKQIDHAVHSRRTCCGKRFSHHSVDMRALKERLKMLDATKLRRLKEILDTEKLAFYSMGAKGMELLEK